MAARLKFLSAMLVALIASAIPSLGDEALQDQIVARTYKLDTAKIEKLPATVLTNGVRLPKASSSELLLALFAREGITFPKNVVNSNSQALPNQKVFYFNERTWELRVRATRRDIPKFEKYLEQLSPDPRPPRDELGTVTRIQIENTFIEVPLVETHLLTLESKPLTLEQKSIFTNLTSLTGFTNVAVLTAKNYQTALTAFQNLTPAPTITQPPALITVTNQTIRIPFDSGSPYVLPEVRTPTVSVPVLIAPGTLIIRGDSDLH